MDGGEKILKVESTVTESENVSRAREKIGDYRMTPRELETLSDIRYGGKVHKKKIKMKTAKDK